MISAFIFYACTNINGEKLVCTSPVAVESEAACREMERNFHATAQEAGGGRVRTRCAPTVPAKDAEPAPQK